MLLDEFLIYNGFLVASVAIAFKTKDFVTAVIFTAVALLFTFNLAYTDVYYQRDYVVSKDYVYNEQNQTEYVTYTYEQVQIDKNLYTWLYAGLILGAMVNLGYKWEKR